MLGFFRDKSWPLFILFLGDFIDYYYCKYNLNVNNFQWTSISHLASLKLNFLYSSYQIHFWLMSSLFCIWYQLLKPKTAITDIISLLISLHLTHHQSHVNSTLVYRYHIILVLSLFALRFILYPLSSLF